MLRSIYRRTFKITLVFAATLSIFACMKHAPVAQPDASIPFLNLTAEDKKIIIAKVNGAEITNYALVDMMNRISAINQRSALSESRETTRKKALDILVLQELALQDAVRQGLRVEDAFIDRAMDQIITKLGHEEGYQSFLAKQHITSVEFRSQVEHSLLIQLILTREVVNKASVSDDEARKEYDLRKGEYRSPEIVSIVDVVISLKQGDRTAMKRANELLTAINADKDKDPAHLAHDDTYSIRTIAFNKENEPELFDAARKIKEGELSGIITTRDGIHIIKLISYTPERQKDFEEVRSAIEEKLKATVQLKRRQEWERELKKDAKIEILDIPMPQERKKP